MTYCVGMVLDEGLIFASDSRTNAGVDHVATFRKMNVIALPGERQIVLLNAGNLATTQSVVSLLKSRLSHDAANLYTVSSLYQAAELVGHTVREVIARDGDGQTQSQGVDYGCSFLVGGQIRGEPPRLFQVYPQGNFIEATADTPYLQIGEAKYGKPIIDRVIRHDTPLAQAIKCTLISFDSTIRSNLSVGLPIDLLWQQRDDFDFAPRHRVTEDDPYFLALRQGWGEGLRSVFGQLPDALWFKHGDTE
ncbi:proteasome-type protease [Vogesella indigofera]|uniref:proteasome-type protease n=1 Tax=Vogesella indigofera TaxID=45465 RepID=UPI00234EA32C|nr:proteasome-type protease [Vogesella indigofera]MDC7698502.1 proteasome-type protease [Vogesella indigofera]